MFIVDSQGNSYGSPLIRLSTTVQNYPPPYAVRVSHGDRIKYSTPRPSLYDAFHFALGATMAHASDCLITFA